MMYKVIHYILGNISILDETPRPDSPLCKSPEENLNKNWKLVKGSIYGVDEFIAEIVLITVLFLNHRLEI